MTKMVGQQYPLEMYEGSFENWEKVVRVELFRSYKFIMEGAINEWFRKRWRKSGVKTKVPGRWADKYSLKVQQFVLFFFEN